MEPKVGDMVSYFLQKSGGPRYPMAMYAAKVLELRGRTKIKIEYKINGKSVTRVVSTASLDSIERFRASENNRL